jgi:protein CpxP
MNNRIIQTLFVTFGLMLASASVLASEGDYDHSWRAEHQRDRAEHFEKHMARLHDTLKLTSAQEAAWSDFSNRMKPVKMDKPDMSKPGHQDWKDMSTPDRLDKMLDRMKSREKLMAEHAEVVRTFYGVLTPDQQKIFDRQFLPHRHRHNHRWHDENAAMRG